MTREKTLGSEIKSMLLLEKTTIDIKAEIEYSKKFLEVTGLKINDIVSCYFTTNHGNAKQSYTQVIQADGVLKQYANGVLFVQSVDKFKKSKTGAPPLYRWEYTEQNIIANINSIQ
jgi:hypothetical protein